MPKPKYRNDAVRNAIATQRDFEDLSRWRRSATTGNLWRSWEGRRVTIFGRADGRFGWSIADDEEGDVRFSPCPFPTENAALRALVEELGVGW